MSFSITCVVSHFCVCVSTLVRPGCQCCVIYGIFWKNPPFTYIKAATFYSIPHSQALVVVSKIVSSLLHPVLCSFEGFRSKSPSQVSRKSDISFEVSGFLSFLVFLTVS